MNACDTKTHHAEDNECRDFRIGAQDQGARETFEASLPILYIKYVGDLIEVYLIWKGMLEMLLSDKISTLHSNHFVAEPAFALSCQIISILS